MGRTRNHYRRLHSEQLENRRLLAADLSALDINNDGHITAIDALQVINHINARSAVQNSQINLSIQAESEDSAQLDCDTNHDGTVSAIDALNIINAINSGYSAVSDTPTDTLPTVIETDTASVPQDDNSSQSTLPGNGSNSSTNTNSGNTSTGGATDVSSPTDNSDSTSDDLNEPTDDSGNTTSPIDDTLDDATDDTSDDSTDDTEDNSGSDSESDSDNDSNSQPDADSDSDADDDSNNDDSSNDPTDTDDADDLEPTPDQMAPELTYECPHEDNLAIVGRVPGPLDANASAMFGHHRHVHALPEGLDENSDGVVTPAEMTAYREAQRVAAVERYFDMLDDNGDGMLSSDELPRFAWRMLSRVDGDGDGQVTVDEFLAGTVRNH